MSSIQSIRQNYEQMRAQATNTYANRHIQQAALSASSEKNAVTDEISISLEGMEALESSRSERVRINPLDVLVEDGTITEEQKEQIDEILRASRESETQVTGTSPLSSLIENGTITEEQDSAIKAAFEKVGHPHGKPPGGMPPGGMPPGGMPPSGDASSTSSTSQLDEETLNQLLESLTENGTITDDQQEAISEALTELINKLFAEKEASSTTNNTSTVVIE